eukprot:jgi/Mesvir1/20713/Mv14909-RA.1
MVAEVAFQPSIAEGVRRCPFLSSIELPTAFFESADAGQVSSSGRDACLHGSSAAKFSSLDEFRRAYRTFHGKDGVVPLSRPERPVCPAAFASMSMSAFSGMPDPIGWGGEVLDSLKKRTSGGDVHRARPHTNQGCPASKCLSRATGGGSAVDASVTSAAGGPCGDLPLHASGAYGASAHATSLPMSALAAEALRPGTNSSSITASPLQGKSSDPVETEPSHGAKTDGLRLATSAHFPSTATSVPLIVQDVPFMESRCPVAIMGRQLQRMVPTLPSLTDLFPGLRHMKCPPAIMAVRAAVAKLPPVRYLRPKSTHLKILAIGGVSFLANVPLGNLRKGYRKFSPEWFVAVHASIPFIVLLRKAVIMPKWAIAFTISAAILGQALGARLHLAPGCPLSNQPEWQLAAMGAGTAVAKFLGTLGKALPAAAVLA